MGPSGCFYSCICLMMLFGTGYVLWVELPVQRRLCSIFVSSVGLPDIHEYSSGCQRTPGFWGVTTFGSSIFKPLILKFSYSISRSMISTISVPYLSACLSNRSLLLLVSPISDIVLETLENDLLLFITFLFIFTCSKS